LDENERKFAEKQSKRRLQKTLDEKFGTKKFGRHKFEEADLDLNLSEEISGNLRNLKSEGNLLHDRFKSFQKRNVIEPRIRVKETKTKLKRYEKTIGSRSWHRLSSKIIDRTSIFLFLFFSLLLLLTPSVCSIKIKQLAFRNTEQSKTLLFFK